MKEGWRTGELTVLEFLEPSPTWGIPLLDLSVMEIILPPPAPLKAKCFHHRQPKGSCVTNAITPTQSRVSPGGPGLCTDTAQS